MKVDVYSDVVCPWCYIGERRLEKALALRPDLEVERRWRPFQLRPATPPRGLPWEEFARRKFGGDANARAAFAQVAAVGEAEGLRFDFGRVASAPNTVDAHRLILFAAEQGLQWETANALFDAYFAGGKDLNDRDALAGIGASAGLDAAEVRAYLASGAGLEEVEASQRAANALGIGGVPHYVFDDRYYLSGAQPVEVFARALDLTLAESTA
jgi:predicted DsbA family dithiol-disulfide isomerase